MAIVGLSRCRRQASTLCYGPEEGREECTVPATESLRSLTVAAQWAGVSHRTATVNECLMALWAITDEDAVGARGAISGGSSPRLQPSAHTSAGHQTDEDADGAGARFRRFFAGSSTGLPHETAPRTPVGLA